MRELDARIYRNCSDLTWSRGLRGLGGLTISRVPFLIGRYRRGFIDKGRRFNRTGPRWPFTRRGRRATAADYAASRTDHPVNARRN